VCESSYKQWPVLAMVEIRCESYASKISARMSQAAKCCEMIYVATYLNLQRTKINIDLIL